MDRRRARLLRMMRAARGSVQIGARINGPDGYSIEWLRSPTPNGRARNAVLKMTVELCGH
jgi:hypothetical protein